MGLTDKITTYFIHKVDKSLDLEKINQVVFISFTSIISIFFYLVFGTFALINERYLLALILGTASAFICTVPTSWLFVQIRLLWSRPLFFFTC